MTSDEAFARYVLESSQLIGNCFLRRAQQQEELYKVLRKHAFAIVWQTLRQRRPDIVNYAIWKALRHAGSFRGEAKFSTWFTKIVRNLCRDEVRKPKGLVEEVSLEEVEELAEPEVGMVRLIRLDLSKLTREERRYVELKEWGYTEKEIGEVFGITEGGASERWMRIKRKLRKI